MLTFEEGGGHGAGLLAAAAEHADEFVDAFFAFDGVEFGAGAARDDFFLDDEMVGGDGGDLGEVGDGDDLVELAEEGHFFTDGAGDFSADVGVDFIEDHEGGGVLAGEGGFYGEHDAGDFSGGGDLAEGVEGFSGVWAEEEVAGF